MNRADGYFAVLELLFIVAFFVTIAIAGTIGRTLSGIWLVLWILVLLSLIPSIRGIFARPVAYGAALPIVVLAGVLLMRIVVVFSAQF
ncbi:MAG: hypothetical protein WA431_07065 [Candidatus Cybelea sp.]